ncbi:MAG TPA: 2-hydroxyacyl-CoA dehydratase family protein [Candidatus Humimicrobiaceae bacterium]
MGIKDRLKTGIQKNLNQRYIKRLLGIMSVKPVLYAYGKTFPSASDRYLNIFTIESLKKAYSGSNRPVGYGSLFVPFEMFYALGITPFLPEVMAGFTAGLGLAPQTLKEASSNWYSQDLCTFHRSASGAVELDLFPRPDYIITSNLACDAAQKSFYMHSLKYDIEKNFYLIDVPYRYSEESLRYLTSQIKNICTDICSKTGKKLDISMFEEAIKLSNELRKLAIEVGSLRKTLVNYPPSFNGLNFIMPFHGLAGTKEAVILYKEIYKDLKKYLDKQHKEGPDRNKPAKRILWLHLKPYYRNEIFDILYRENCRVVFEEINHVYWPELDYKKPFESLAKKMLSNFLAGSIDNRIDITLKAARDYKADGTILFSHWGCRQSNGGARIIKDSLKKLNIPTLVLDGDCVDQSNSSQGQVKTRLQGFIEILNS